MIDKELKELLSNDSFFASGLKQYKKEQFEASKNITYYNKYLGLEDANYERFYDSNKVCSLRKLPTTSKIYTGWRWNMLDKHAVSDFSKMYNCTQQEVLVNALRYYISKEFYALIDTNEYKRFNQGSDIKRQETLKVIANKSDAIASLKSRFKALVVYHEFIKQLEVDVSLMQTDRSKIYSWQIPVWDYMAVIYFSKTFKVSIQKVIQNAARRYLLELNYKNAFNVLILEANEEITHQLYFKEVYDEHTDYNN